MVVDVGVMDSLRPTRCRRLAFEVVSYQSSLIHCLENISTMNHRRGNAVASEKEGLGERKKRGTRKEDEFYVQRHPHSGDKVVTDATRAGRRYTSSVAANNDNKRVMQNVHLVASIAGRKYK